MVDLTITAANVIKGANSIIDNGLAGASILAGQTVYKEAATGLYKLADSNSATVEARLPVGIALNPALTGQPVAVQTSGDLGFGAILTAGAGYYCSETPGGIQPVADLTAGELVTLLGFATSTSNLNIRIQSSGVVI